MTLRQVRRARNLTQTQLAQKSGIDQAVISDIEIRQEAGLVTGILPNPKWKTVSALARALEVAPEEIFSLSEPVPAHAEQPAAEGQS